MILTLLTATWTTVEIKSPDLMDALSVSNTRLEHVQLAAPIVYHVRAEVQGNVMIMNARTDTSSHQQVQHTHANRAVLTATCAMNPPQLV